MANPTGKGSPFVKGNKLSKGLTKENSNTGRPEKYTEEWLKEEAKALIEWMQKPDSYFFKCYAWERGYRPDQFDAFCEKSIDFKLAYQQAKDIQENKCMVMGLTRSWDPGFTARVMARICPSIWKNSWDKDEDKAEVIPAIIINKIEK